MDAQGNVVVNVVANGTDVHITDGDPEKKVIVNLYDDEVPPDPTHNCKVTIDGDDATVNIVTPPGSPPGTGCGDGNEVTINGDGGTVNMGTGANDNDIAVNGNNGTVNMSNSDDNTVHAGSEEHPSTGSKVNIGGSDADGSDGNDVEVNGDNNEVNVSGGSGGMGTPDDPETPEDDEFEAGVRINGDGNKYDGGTSPGQTNNQAEVNGDNDEVSNGHPARGNVTRVSGNGNVVR